MQGYHAGESRGPDLCDATAGPKGVSTLGRYRVSLDSGGKFTDVVADDEASRTNVAGKSFTTLQNLSGGVFAATTRQVILRSLASPCTVPLRAATPSSTGAGNMSLLART